MNTNTNTPDVVDDLTALVARLAHSVRSGSPSSFDIANTAIDYLLRHGLAGSPLRAATAAPQDERDQFEIAVKSKVGITPVRELDGTGYLSPRFSAIYDGWLLARAALPAQAVDPVPVRMLPSPDLWRNGDGFQGYTAKPGDGPWYTAETVRALLEAPVQDVAPSVQQASELAADILIQLANEAPINGNNLAQRRVLWAAAQLRSGALQAVAKDVAPSDAPADMFWDKDNPESDLHTENLGEAIDYLADEIPLNELPIDVTLMRAKRLPNIRVRITGYVDGEGHTYEVITEARTQEGAAS